jgi:hypothetical protein
LRAAFPTAQHRAFLPRSLSLQLSEEHTLSLLWHPTPDGLLALGILRPSPLEDKTLCPFLHALDAILARPYPR